MLSDLAHIFLSTFGFLRIVLRMLAISVCCRASSGILSRIARYCFFFNSSTSSYGIFTLYYFSISHFSIFLSSSSSSNVLLSPSSPTLPQTYPSKKPPNPPRTSSQPNWVPHHPYNPEISEQYKQVWHTTEETWNQQTRQHAPQIEVFHQKLMMSTW